MIVKNEEKNIEKALTWGRDFMYEQIVVDTGSTDRTPEMAKELGAKVFFYQWEDDFAAAKNYAIDQAGGEWIVFMDADEYPAPGDEKKIPALLEQIQNKDFDGIYTGCQQIDEEGNIASSGTQVRIFRNRPDIRYRRRIHEQLVSTKGRKLRLGDAAADISIFHTGYQEAAMKEKRRDGRNKRLILAELTADPSNTEMMGYMGDEYFGEGDLEEAKNWYFRAIQGLNQELLDNDQRSASTFTKLLLILTGEGRSGEASETPSSCREAQGRGEDPLLQWKEAEPVYKQAVKALPGEGDFDYVAALYFYRENRFGEAAEYIERALGKLEQFGCANRAMYLSANLPSAYNLLIKCLYETGQREKCVNQAVSYLKYMPEDMAALSWLLKALAVPPLTTGGMEQILLFLGKLYDFSGLRAKLLVTRCAKAAGCGELGSYMEQRLFTREERTALGIR
ncbi:MAG: glycosyltransferase family 2 protein [Clostridium sp.]|nr:glycosyltransferase family 2 protein [Clostridium sp.]